MKQNLEVIGIEKKKSGSRRFDFADVVECSGYSASILARRMLEERSGVKAESEEGEGTVPVYSGDKVVRSVRLDGNGFIVEGGETLHDGEYIVVGNGKDVKYIMKDVQSAVITFAETGCSVAVYMNSDNLPGVAKTFSGVSVVAGYDDVEDALSVTSNVCDINAHGGNREEDLIIGSRVFNNVRDYYFAGGDINIALGTKKATRISPLWWEMKRSRRQEWIIDGVLPDAPGLVVLYSAPNVGKTYLVIDMALAVATGKTEWFGHKVRGGKVLYLCGEGNGGFFTRLKCWLQEHREMEVEKVPFVYDRTLFSFDHEPEYQEFVRCLGERCREKNPRLVIIDTMNLFMSKDENSTEETSNFLKTLKNFCNRFNCTVILVHHSGLKEEGRERGSSTIRGSVDSSIRITRSGDVRKIEQVKNRHGELFEPMYFVLEKHPVVEFNYEEERADGWNEPPVDCIVRQIDPPGRSEFSKGEMFLINFCLDRIEKDMPWTSFRRSELIEYGRKVLTDTPVSVTNQLNPRQKGKLLNSLLRDGILKEMENTDETVIGGKPDEGYSLVSRKILDAVEMRLGESTGDYPDDETGEE